MMSKAFQFAPRFDGLSAATPRHLVNISSPSKCDSISRITVGTPVPFDVEKNALRPSGRISFEQWVLPHLSFFLLHSVQ